MKELEQMQKVMDEFFAYLEKPEQKKRDAEAEKERQHRIDEGLDDEAKDNISQDEDEHPDFDFTEEESRTDYAQGMYDSGMKESDFL